MVSLSLGELGMSADSGELVEPQAQGERVFQQPLADPAQPALTPLPRGRIVARGIESMSRPRTALLANRLLHVAEAELTRNGYLWDAR